ncbi:hypothetical protein Zmor_007310 [Zophobas morio]|uniref:Uncharacterized protein n=1 Tax=Zophobas morio TaxID=2755281 RepID=A0AA38IRV2_9CUCU|nr:hypothetical protein Zmor_008630 [Zophobas morio]KAJ3662998.1 hypothetical protein Zmor_007310 [Zophobas morio]
MSAGRQSLAGAAITCLNATQLNAARIPIVDGGGGALSTPDGRYNTTRCQVVCKPLQSTNIPWCKLTYLNHCDANEFLDLTDIWRFKN